MIVFPLIRLVGLRAATASSRVATVPMLVRSRPSRTRWTISPSWARSDSTTKSTARPSGGRGPGGPEEKSPARPAGGRRPGRPDDGHQSPSGADQACGPFLDVPADDVEHQ